MNLYATFLTGMSALFGLAAVVLVVMGLVALQRGRGRRAAAYLALALLACVVIAGFHFFRTLILTSGP
jgi:hypothetical protein